jgi:transposase
VDPKTVRAVLRRKARQKKPRPSLLDPFRPLIRSLVLEQELTAVRVYEEIVAVGYKGGYTILKKHIRGFRPRTRRRPHLRFETDPGVQGQVDLSPYTLLFGEVPTKVVCFSFILGFSRWRFMRFVLSADVHSVCYSHVLAFEAAGGVPHEILYDRMKQVVLESYVDGVIYHPLFEKMVRHYGFRAVPLAPGYKEGKGKVEEPFRFTEDNFLAGRHFRDLADLNEQAARWLERTNVRLHRTTGQQPTHRLAEERPQLIPLPPKRFVAAEVVPRIVGDDFCVAWLSVRYSVPPRLVGKDAWLHVLEGRIEVHVDGQIVAEHAVVTDVARVIAPEHEAEFRQRSTSRHVLGQQFLRLGSGAEQFAAGLREARGAAAGYHMSKILQLADRVGVIRVAEAMRHATRYGAFDHNAVARIVTGRHPPRPPGAAGPVVPASTAVPAHVADFLKGAGSFQRSLAAYERLARDRTSDPPDQSAPHERPRDPDGNDGGAHG